jgi:hypothetical protein
MVISCPARAAFISAAMKKTTKGTSFKNDKRINKIHNNPPTLTEL